MSAFTRDHLFADMILDRRQRYAVTVPFEPVQIADTLLVAVRIMLARE